MKQPVVVSDPVPCELAVRRMDSNVSDAHIVIDLTYVRDGTKHRTQVRLTLEQLALAITGMGGVIGTVTGYTAEAKS